MKNKIFKGIYTALITPFKNEEIDYLAFSNLIEKQVEANVNGIVVAGSTGEASSLNEEEYKEILSKARSLMPSSIKLIAGISANCSKKASKLAQIAKTKKVDGLLSVTPYYNRAPQRGLIEYYRTIHDSCDLPIILYSVPSRTGVDFKDETILELATLPRILGFKDCGNDIERPLRLQKKLPQNFSLLSGEDTSCVAFSSHGGVGCISVISNIFPKTCKNLQDLLLEGNFSKALELQTKLLPVYNAIFVDTNPIPIKEAAKKLKLCSNEVREPLMEMLDSQLIDNINKTIEKSIKEYNLE